MNILMFTNTFSPHVGGVARSVESFCAQFRALAHRVVVVAPHFEGAPADEPDVVRVPAIANVNDTGFSLPVPTPGALPLPEGFYPDVVHSHHPFLLGSTALRTAAASGLPVVFTHHTRYETYTHYLPIDSPVIQRFVTNLAAGYCNLCDAVVAPSESISQMLREHAVTARIEVIPTGVEVEKFQRGNGASFRESRKIDAQAFIVGHVGRLAPEKNLGFLAEAVAEYLKGYPRAHFLVVGHGPSEEELALLFDAPGLRNRLHMVGTLEGEALIDAYAAMDVFAFASQSETQGLVLAEAMAAGTPVVAVDASGVRDVVEDGLNGRLLANEDQAAFVAALREIAEQSPEERAQLLADVEQSAQNLTMRRSANRLIALYESLVVEQRKREEIDNSPWASALRWLDEQMKIMSNTVEAAGQSLE